MISMSRRKGPIRQGPGETFRGNVKVVKKLLAQTEEDRHEEPRGVFKHQLKTPLKLNETLTPCSPSRYGLTPHSCLRF